MRRRHLALLSTLAAVGLTLSGGAPQVSAAPASVAGATHVASSTAARNLPKCSSGAMFCSEVYDSEDVFGEGVYVGHDEPATMFYSNKAGSGNQNHWKVTIPKDPPHAVVPGRTWNFQLHPAFWFGMAMCDTQSYPEQVSTCTPDSNSNITALARHPGAAYMELQFYAPGWVKQFDGSSCDVTKWCVALVIWSLSRDPVNGLDLNPTCQSQILGGLEYGNFAYVTRNGVPGGPPNPLQFDPVASGVPSANAIYMNAGDQVDVGMKDTTDGLRIDIGDRTTHQTGFMVASAKNHFGQIKFAPTGTSCTEMDYNFHPMYSTSTPETRVPWAAHSYNVAFTDEIGHFDHCTAVTGFGGDCAATALEGDPHANSNTVNDQEKSDPALDDNACFNPPPPPSVQVTGCAGTNAGFDGVPYHLSWADGNTNLHPDPIVFTSPLTGSEGDTNYSRAAFEADLPRIESTCNRVTGVGCTLIPTTDDGVSADFYPFFSIGQQAGGCQWAFGSYIPGFTQNDFGGNVQYGPLLSLEYLVFGGHGATNFRYNDFRQILSKNPCPAGNNNDNNNQAGN